MTVQRVVVTRSGGFAGVTVSAQVDDPDEAAEIAEAVQRAAGNPAGRRRDDFVYAFTIVTATSSDGVELTGAQLPGDLRPRLQALLQP